MDGDGQVDVQIVKHPKETRRDPLDRLHLDPHYPANHSATSSARPDMTQVDQRVAE